MKFKIFLALTILFGCLTFVFFFIGMRPVATGLAGFTIITALIANLLFWKER